MNSTLNPENKDTEHQADMEVGKQNNIFLHFSTFYVS